MSKLKITIDGRSFLFGILGCLLFLSLAGFKSEGQSIPGRYQAEVGTNSMIILNTATGKYLRSIGTISSGFGHGIKWVEEDFNKPKKYISKKNKRK